MLYGEWTRMTPKPKPQRSRLCPRCLRPVSGHARRRFCSERCKQAWHRAEARAALALLRQAEQAGAQAQEARGATKLLELDAKDDNQK